MNFRTAAVTLIMCGVIVLSAPAADWPNYRGPDYDGISTETDWSPAALNAKKILWSAEVGIGFSGISVVDGKAYTMGNINKDTDVVYCFDAVSGDEVWRHEYSEDLNPKYYEGGCSATPTVAEGKVYTISKTGHVFCLDAATGDVVWEKALAYEQPTWGIATSALVLEDKAIFNVGTSGLALNKDNGQVIWKSDDGKCGYATPVPYERNGKQEVAIFGKDTIMGIDPATGTVLWSYPWATQNDVNASDPIIYDNKVFVTSGYNRGCGLVDISGEKPKLLWENKNMRSQMSGPVLIDGYLYGFDDNQLACLDWKTGDQNWAERKPRKGALSAAGNKLLVIGEAGTLFVVEAAPTAYQELAAAEVLSGPRCWTVPTLSDGRFYVRNSRGQMVCISLQTPQ